MMKRLLSTGKFLSDDWLLQNWDSKYKIQKTKLSTINYTPSPALVPVSSALQELDKVLYKHNRTSHRLSIYWPSLQIN